MEQTCNYGKATINMGGGLSNVATTLTVTGQVNVPSTGTFRVLIESEIVKVTAVSGNNWTIVRGTESTSAVSHATGIEVDIILTKDAVDGLLPIQQNGTEIANRRSLNFLSGFVVDDTVNKVAKIYNSLGEVITPPVLANFSWVNQSSATATQAVAGASPIILTAPPVTGQQVRALIVSTIATPWTLIAKFECLSMPGSNSDVGLILQESSSGKLMTFHIFNNAQYIQVNELSSPTGYTGTPGSLGPNTYCFVPLWWRITDDGTNRKYYVGRDGLNWLLLFTITTATFMTTDRVGFYADSAQTSNPALILLESWDYHSGSS